MTRRKELLFNETVIHCCNSWHIVSRAPVCMRGTAHSTRGPTTNTAQCSFKLQQLFHLKCFHRKKSQLEHTSGLVFSRTWLTRTQLRIVVYSKFFVFPLFQSNHWGRPHIFVRSPWIDGDIELNISAVKVLETSPFRDAVKPNFKPHSSKVANCLFKEVS